MCVSRKIMKIIDHSCARTYDRAINSRLRIRYERRLPWLVRLARICILIPSAVWIVDAPQAVVVSPSAHYQIDLLYPMIRRHVQSLMLLRDLHRLYRLAGRDVEHVQQDRLGFAVIVDPLYHLVNATVACNTRRRTCAYVFSSENVNLSDYARAEGDRWFGEYLLEPA